LVGDSRRAVLALLAQLLRDVAQVARVLMHLLAGLGRPLVDLVASSVTRLAGGPAHLLARLVASLLRLLLRLVLDAAVVAGRPGGGAGVCRPCHVAAPSSRCESGGVTRGLLGVHRSPARLAC